MKITSYFFIFLFVLCFITSCSPGNKQQQWKAKHVIFIGMDGWGSYSMEKADMPNVKKLMREGSYTLEKRTVLPSSSAVNWASIFMGAGPELHGYTTCCCSAPELKPRVVSHYGIFPSIWGLFRDANPDGEMGYIYEWDGMQYIAEVKAMDKNVNPADGAAVCREAVAYIKESKPDFAGIIFAEPDYVGHGAGHDTPDYYGMLKVLDGYVGEIVEAVKEAGMIEETIFIITSDHGGINKGHGGKTMEEMETPYIISGKGIKKGHIITESVMQYDVASTIADIFRLEQPQVWIGRSIGSSFE